MDLVRPLGLAGVPCAVVADPSEPAFFSRFTTATVEWPAPLPAEERIARLIAFARAQAEPPVVLAQNDRDLLLISRNRARFGESARLALGDAELIEDVVDKARFVGLAERLDLPVARAVPVSARDGLPADLDLRFPLLVKPVCRDLGPWLDLEPAAKAIEAPTAESLRALWEPMATAGLDVVVQELVPGPESDIESYHVYVDPGGEIAGEFTGRKLRTHPRKYGYSTAVMTTHEPGLAALGREIVAKLGLRGVAKLDFKRVSPGDWRLLEVNPRFNLWHHLGAIAGVNLPAIAYADLAGGSRPSSSRARAGVCWCLPWRDVAAARSAGIPMWRWIAWMLRCEAKSSVAWDDPLPFLRGRLLARLVREGRAR